MSVNGQDIFTRDYSLVVAPTGSAGALGAIESSLGFDVSELRCVFKVKKTLKREPNTATIQIYNLAESSRRVLESSTKLVVRLEAGYKELGVSQLFLGQVRSAWTEWEGPDAITTITTGDSEKEMQEARLNMSFGKSLPVDVALTSIVQALGVGQGNLATAIALLKSKGAAAMFGLGTAVSGNAARLLTDICRSAGLEWSIQDGVLQILDLNKPLSDKAVELSAETGLVGSPTIDYNATTKTKAGGILVKAKAFLIPELTPGRKISFKSKGVTGGFRIDEVTYQGDTHGKEWYAELACRKY